VRGIRSKIYPREKGIHVFQAPSIVQEHQKERNPRDKILLVDLRSSSSPEFVHCQQNDYNRHTNVPFVYQSTSLKYYEPIED
jgi:hypothetical protein